MSLTVCLESGCPTLTNKSRCKAHERARDKARGTSTERGYGYDHQQGRAAWSPRVATGTIACRRCLEPIDANEPWDLGHPDADCLRPTAPEHIGCNRAVSGRP